MKDKKDTFLFYFHCRFCSYLPRVPILVEGTVCYYYNHNNVFTIIIITLLLASRGGKSTTIFYSSKSTITVMKLYLSTSKSTSLKI